MEVLLIIIMVLLAVLAYCLNKHFVKKDTAQQSPDNKPSDCHCEDTAERAEDNGVAEPEKKTRAPRKKTTKK